MRLLSLFLSLSLFSNLPTTGSLEDLAKALFQLAQRKRNRLELSSVKVFLCKPFLLELISEAWARLNCSPNVRRASTGAVIGCLLPHWNFWWSCVSCGNCINLYVAVLRHLRRTFRWTLSASRRTRHHCQLSRASWAKKKNNSGYFSLSLLIKREEEMKSFR